MCLPLNDIANFKSPMTDHQGLLAMVAIDHPACAHRRRQHGRKAGLLGPADRTCIDDRIRGEDAIRGCHAVTIWIDFAGASEW